MEVLYDGQSFNTNCGPVMFIAPLYQSIGK